MLATFTVTEKVRPLEPVTADPFIAVLETMAPVPANPPRLRTGRVG